MLAPRGAGVPDRPPPFPFALARLPWMARTFEPFISCLLPDEEAWHALFDDSTRLDVFRALHGNRKGKRPNPRPRSLFDAESQ